LNNYYGYTYFALAFCYLYIPCVHIHKNLYKKNIPLSIVHLSNQIVCICAFLSNFHPALVPQPSKVHLKPVSTNTLKDYQILKMKLQVIVMPILI